MTTHIRRRQKRDKNAPTVTATAWCGYQARVGEYQFHPYIHQISGVRLVRPELKLYSASYRSGLAPREGFVPEDCGSLADCPHCKAALRSGMPIEPKGRRIKA